MNALTRRKLIISELKEKGNISTKDLSEKLEVSFMTIRRDLIYFSKQGIVTLSHGGASLNKGALFENTMSLKQTEMIQEKNLIGKYCSELIGEGDSVFLDSGSTNQAIASYIANKKNIVVLTHSLLVANSLIHSKNIKLIMVPGVFREKSMAFLGEFSTEFIKKFKLDLYFMACEGLDLEYGATLPDPSDAEIKRVIASRSQKVIVSVDSSKIGKSFFVSCATIQEIQWIVTDNGIDPKIKKEFEKKGIKVSIV